MLVLSAGFSALVCLCATLPLLPARTEAAYLHSSNLMAKDASSSHSHHWTSSASRTHSYDGKHHGHKAPNHRAEDLPPLLRRHRAHDLMKAQDYGDQDPRDHVHPKPPRSAFARSRYRREPGALDRRSSIYFPGELGSRYQVSRIPPRNRGNARTGTAQHLVHAYDRRQSEEGNLVVGKIDIMGATQSANSTQRLGSLMVDYTPVDWTLGQNSMKAFPLNASTTNQTQFILIPMDGPSNAAGSSNKHVTLATEVFDAGSTEMVMYCATYDPDPDSTSTLLMTPCIGEAQLAPANDAADSCSDAANDASSNTHQSQIFSYDPFSGRIEPISTTANSSRVDNSSDDSSGCAEARVRRDNVNSTASHSAMPSSTTTSAAPATSTSQQARSVTLVYVASALEVPASSNTTSAGMGQMAVFTTTITTTVVATVTTSESSTRTVTPAQAAVSTPASTKPSPSTTTMTTPSVLVTVSRQSSSSLSSVPATATSKVPEIANESLEVEIIGVTASTTARSSLTSSTTTTMTTTSSYGSMSPSLNAQAVASSLANAMVHPRRRALYRQLDA